ncbi:MAG TPA: glycosyl hydrolase family 18 protein [Gemmatimonadaceae bacterium]|nr:glycosyl hydrolase family 18 protein [Gemmatimonadaceae bacterium]
MARRILGTLLVGALIGAARAGAQSPERLFYYVDREDSYRSFVAHLDQITVVGPQVYTVDSLGLVFGSLDSRVLKLAKAHGVKVMPLVVNEGFNQPGLRRLLADTAARSRAIASLVELCRRHGYWGIQFDIENINIQDRDRFTSWFTDAARTLHAAGFTASAAIVHETDDLPGPTGYHRFLADSWRTFDLAALAKAADFLSVMSYDQHTRRTPPGPVAGMPWVRSVVEYFLRSVPAEKLSMGIPLYGDYWSARSDPTPERARTSANSVSWFWGSGLAERNGATVKWDDVQQVPYASFEVGGTFEWLYLENARSFSAKLALMREKKLRGFSAWVLGPEDPEIWNALR